MDEAGPPSESTRSDVRHYPKVVLVTGACRFLGGYLTARLTQNPLINRVIAVDAVMPSKDLLRRMGYEAASIEARPRADGGTDVVCTQSVLDVPVLSGTLTLSYDASGALTALTGSFFPADELLRVGDSVSCSCADALVALLSRRDTLGWVGSSVTAMTQGFRRADSASAAARLTPVWRIDTDAGSFYVSGVTREVTPADD
mgnify:CR=1 FL=1